MQNALPTSTFGIEFELSESFEDYDCGCDYLDCDCYENRSDTSLRAYRSIVRTALQSDPQFANVPTSIQGNSQNGRSWVIKEDCSCGVEITTPALTWENWPQVELVTKALRQNNSRITESCGLHVHHEVKANEAQMRQLFILWAAYEPMFMAMVRNCRANNHYCMPVLREERQITEHLEKVQFLVGRMDKADSFQHFIYGRDRYYALNLVNWWNTGRIEIRLHHGTLRTNDIKWWTLFTQLFIQYALNAGTDDLAEVCKLSPMDQLTHICGIFAGTYEHEWIPQLTEAAKGFIARRHPRLAAVAA